MSLDRVFTKVDVLALPTVRNIAPLVEDEPSDPTEAVLASLRRNWMILPMAYNTKPTNYTGHPALAVPCGKVDRMPIGLQLVGNFLADPLLLRAGYSYQRAVDWEAITGVG
jgi:amidase